LVIGLALFAAALHASWNALLRSGADRLWSLVVMSLATTVVALPFAVALPVPHAASWTWLAFSAVVQVAYSFVLINTYRQGDFSEIYPVVRGSVPLLVTLGGVAFARQHPNAASLFGVCLVSFGIMSLAAGGRRASRRALALALATGLTVAIYVTADAVGVRLSGDAQSYAAWVFLIYGALLLATYLALRRRLVVDPRSPETLKALASGVVSLVSYGAVISALALAPAGPVAALRECSIVFAVLIGRLFLRERLSPRRLLACGAVALGAVCLSLVG